MAQHVSLLKHGIHMLLAQLVQPTEATSVVGSAVHLSFIAWNLVVTLYAFRDHNAMQRRANNFSVN
jgi:hypothetical protein